MSKSIFILKIVRMHLYTPSDKVQKYPSV